MKYAFIRDNSNDFSKRAMCRVLNVAPSGYYAWRSRPQSAHAQRDAELLGEVAAISLKSRCTYGSPRIHAALSQRGVQCSRKRVARLMRTSGLGVKVRRRFRKTTDSNHAHSIAANVLNRNFSPEKIGAPNRWWAGDITYIPTAEGWLYLAVVLDLYSRRVIGWSMARSLEATFVVDALRMAVTNRGNCSGVTHHSDRGSQYADKDVRDFLKRFNIRRSMSRKADCWDNAVVESFFGTLKREWLDDQRFLTRAEARSAVFEFIETWYNSQRLHSTLGYRTPIAFEADYAA